MNIALLWGKRSVGERTSAGKSMPRRGHGDVAGDLCAG
jgi:hypothetical protein